MKNIEKIMQMDVDGIASMLSTHNIYYCSDCLAKDFFIILQEWKEELPTHISEMAKPGI